MYQLAAMGINLVAATFIGLFMGWAIDNWLTPKLNWHTSPWFTLVFLLFGIIAGFRNMFQYGKEDGRPRRSESGKREFPGQGQRPFLRQYDSHE